MAALDARQSSVCARGEIVPIHRHANLLCRDIVFMVFCHCIDLQDKFGRESTYAKLLCFYKIGETGASCNTVKL